MKTGLSVLFAILLGFCAFQGTQLIKLQSEQTELKNDFAEINRINYGLFNVNLWKDKALSIFQDKISGFQINPDIYKELDVQLQVYLRALHKEYIVSGKLIDQLLEEASKKSKINKMFLKLIKDNVHGFVDNMDLKSKIPMIAKELAKELKKNEPTIKGFLEEELNGMLFDETSTIVYTDPRNVLYEKYNVDDFKECSQKITPQIERLDQSIKEKLKLIYILLIGAVLIWVLLYRVIGYKFLVVGLTLISLIFLYLGVILPMIDIDARLNEFSFNIIGNDITFDQQVLYFQSKSILDVTWTLLEGSGLDLKIVGLLILLFSIVFPFFKLILSTLFLFMEKVEQSKIAQNVIFYLGKWSMADVFVVAMFMAYIGFYGLVTSQMGEIAPNEGGYAVETLNYSKLSPGALFFTSYCILSIITSIIINRHFTSSKENSVD